MTRLTAVEANATYVPSAEIAGDPALPLAVLSGPEGGPDDCRVDIGVEPVPDVDLRAGELARDLARTPIGVGLGGVGVGSERDVETVVGQGRFAETRVLVGAVRCRGRRARDRDRVPRLTGGLGHVDDDDAVDVGLRGVELVGVGDHRTAAGDRRREPRIDVVGRALVAGAVVVGRDQLPPVERSATARQLHPIDVPATFVVVVAEQIEWHLGDDGGVAAVAADDREHAVAEAHARLRCGQLDLAAIGTVPQPHGAGPPVVGVGRRTGVHDETTVAGHRRIGTRLRLDRHRRTLARLVGRPP
jgi:hypothetical protein